MESKVSQEAIAAALEECQRLLNAAKKTSISGSQLCAALNKLSKQVLAALAILQSEVAAEKVEPYNPLKLQNLAETIRAKFDEQKLVNLNKLERFDGSGVYALYYTGDFYLIRVVQVKVARKERHLHRLSDGFRRTIPVS
ncbi:MAG: hypothetical protein L0Z53_18915 [Acidobacteriales bacterium]|nr:hypothetical protein [Terriglobales bacterium]